MLNEYLDNELYTVLAERKLSQKEPLNCQKLHNSILRD